MNKKEIIAWILLACAVFSALPIFTGNQPGDVIAEHDGAVEVYFCPREMCKEKLLMLIQSSSEIKCAFYDLNLADVIAALKEKNAEVVIEDSNSIDGFYSGYSFALMHNKFCIFDNEIVFTGSLNPTERENYYNNNNIVLIRSGNLAKNYLDEFSELRRGFHGKGRKVSNPKIEIKGNAFGDVTIENYFCPEDNCKKRVLSALEKAKSSVYFMTYSFTDEDIGNLLWNLHSSGVDVKGVFDKKQSSVHSRYEDLREFSVLGSGYTMHHKVFIIDNKTVITGSYNPTKNANEKNDENLLIMHNKEIAKRYGEEFRKLFYYKEKIPEQAWPLLISKVMYNPKGNDAGNEFVEIKNIGRRDINLDYYFLSDNKTETRLSGIISENQSISFMPKFSLKNKKGLLLLKNSEDIIDFVAWEGLWGLRTGEGQFLVRKENYVAESSWKAQ